MGLPWRWPDPPAEPPAGCRDRQRWRRAYAAYCEHLPGRAGAGCACDGVWPCPSHRRAVRALVTAFLQAGPVLVIGSADRTAECRWCRRTVAPHPICGWVHSFDGLLVCEVSKDHGSGVTIAEPAAGSDAGAYRGVR